MVSRYTQVTRAQTGADLESLVLQHALDGGIFAAGRELSLEDDAKGAISNNLALGVRNVSCLARGAVLDLFADDFCSRWISRSRASRQGACVCRRTSHPYGLREGAI
jgi:hypothetical protein